MVGKPNLMPNSHSFNNQILDSERELSMADEGGASGAFVENQDQIDPKILDQICHAPRSSWDNPSRISDLLQNRKTWISLAALAVGVGAGIGFARWMARRSQNASLTESLGH